MELIPILGLGSKQAWSGATKRQIRAAVIIIVQVAVPNRRISR